MNEPNYGSGTEIRTLFECNRVMSWKSAAKIAPIVIEILAPKSVIDMGFGSYPWLYAFQCRGVTDVVKLNSEYVHQDICDEERQLLACACRSRIIDIKRTFDLAIALDVADQLPQSQAQILVADLVRCATAVLFSAAIPGQGSGKSRNEQWPDYWEKLFAAVDYVAIDCFRLRFWNDPDIELSHKHNLVLYVRRSELANYPNLIPIGSSTSVLRLVHPDLYARTVVALSAVSKTEEPDFRFPSILTDPSQFQSNLTSKLIALCESVHFVENTGVSGDVVDCGEGGWMDVVPMARILKERNSNRRRISLIDLSDDTKTLNESEPDFQFHSECQGKVTAEDTSANELKAITKIIGYESAGISYVRIGAGGKLVEGDLPTNIAILRLRTKSYRITLRELQRLYPCMQQNAILLIDNYGEWESCKNAVDKYFRDNSVPIYLSRIDRNSRIGVKPGNRERFWGKLS